MRQIKVGDILTVKQWDEMEREYPLTELGSIDGDGNTFTESMKEWCGKSVTITRVEIYSRQIVHLRIKEDNGYWDWCLWMFKNEDENRFHKPSQKDLSSLFGD